MRGGAGGLHPVAANIPLHVVYPFWYVYHGLAHWPAQDDAGVPSPTAGGKRRTTVHLAERPDLRQASR